MVDEVERGLPHVNLDDEEQVKKEIDKAFGIFPHLARTASSDGLSCPACGSGHVAEVKKGENTSHLMKVFHCNDCSAGYTRYEVDPDKSEWGPNWHENVVTYDLEGFPYYLYFTPGTNNCTGIGLDIFPWK